MSAPTAETTANPLWQDQIYEQIQEVMTASVLDETAIATRPWLVIGFTNDEQPTLLARCETHDQADEEAVLHASKGYEHIKIAQLTDVGFDIPEPAPVPEDPEGKRLFDADAFDSEEMRLPKVDGQGVTKIQAKFAGGVWLERSDPRDVALIRDNQVSDKLTLLVDVTAGPPVPSMATNRDGGLDVLCLSRSFHVTSVNRAATSLEPREMLELGVRRMLDAGTAIDEVISIAEEAAETRPERDGEDD